jgi:cob(I)alamin adenosyltransferase
VQELDQIQTNLKSLEAELATESEARRYTDEEQLKSMIQTLAGRVAKLEQSKANDAPRYPGYRE